MLLQVHSTSDYVLGAVLHARGSLGTAYLALSARRITNTFLYTLSVRLGDSLKLVLLLDGIRVGRALSSVDELLGEALGNGLDVSEGSLSSSNGQERDSLVDSSERRHIDSLSSDSSRRTDSSRVFSGTTVDDGVDHNLQRVEVGEQVDDLQSVLDDSHGLELLTVVSAVHHQGVGETLDNGALGLSEPLCGVSAGSVGDVDGLGDLDIVGERNVLDLNVVVGPLVEELDGAGLGDNVLGELESKSNRGGFVGHCVSSRTVMGLKGRRVSEVLTKSHESGTFLESVTVFPNGGWGHVTQKRISTNKFRVQLGGGIRWILGGIKEGL